MSGTSTPLVFDGTSAAVLPGARVAIAVARWNESVTRRLLAGALQGLAVLLRRTTVFSFETNVFLSEKPFFLMKNHWFPVKKHLFPI